MKYRAITAFTVAQLLCTAAFFMPPIAEATGPTKIERAEGATLSKAVGHWSRARALMNVALREFDQGTALVDPDALIDANQLRSEILDKIQILERLIDPQPRASEEGVRYEPMAELLGVKKN